VAHSDNLRLNRKPREYAPAPLGKDVVEQDGVETADHEIAIGMHIVIVRDRLDPKFSFGAKEDFVSDGAAEGTDTSAAQIVEGAKCRRVGIADTQHFVDLVIRNGGRHSGATRRRVFNPTQADLGIAALDGLIDGGKRNVQEYGLAPEAARNQVGDFDIEAD